MRSISRRWGKSKEFIPAFGPVLLESIWQFWKLQMRVSKLSRALKRLESQGDQLQWMSEENNSSSNHIQRNKISSYKSNQEGQRLIHWKSQNITKPQAPVEWSSWSHGHTQGSKDMTWAFVHKVTLGRTSQDREQAAEGGKEYWGKLLQVSCSLWVCTLNSTQDSGLLFHQAAQSLCLRASHCLNPFLPQLSPTSPCRPRWQTERVLTKCWECSTVWACSWWHGNSPKYTLWSVCLPLSVYVLFQLKSTAETSQAVQWLRLHLPVQSVQVPPLMEKLRSHVSRPKHQNIKQKQYCQNGLQKACFCHGSDDLLYLLNLFVSFFFFFLMSKVWWAHEPNYLQVLLHELMGLERFWIASSVRNDSNECLNILESENVSCSVISDSSTTPWAVARRAPLFMGLPKQEYWSGLPFPSPGALPNPGIKSRSPALQADSLPSEPRGKP